MRIHTILILALITLILALAAGCTSTTTAPADSAKSPTTAAPVVQTTAAIVPSVQTADISGSAIVGCAPGTTPCGNACVNLKTNSTHCGSCGNTCPMNQPVCEEAQCGSA